jgi:hypothetical protein
MNTIEWKIGNKYIISDIMSEYEGTFEGFITNQCPINWENKDSYRNHATNTIWLVFSFVNYEGKTRYVISTPSIDSNIHECMGNRQAYSWISLRGIEYGDSIDQLIRKLQENWVFTKELSYDAKYKEGFRQE